MNSTPVAKVPEVPGIDLDHRPRDYFWAVDLNVPLPSSISGEVRREIFRALIEAGCPVPGGLDAEVLDEVIREAWGEIHPSLMGGEYLPPLRKGEVEIARISLESVTADQISVRARRVREKIRFRIVNEYAFKYVCHPASSDAPLCLRELVTLMESASDSGSIIFPILAMNSQHSTRADLATFITVTSEFYADIEPYYRAMTDAWLEERDAPEPALRRVDAGLLAALLEDSLATGVPISEGEFGWLKLPEYRLGGCILRDENPNEASHTNEPDGGKPR